MVETFFSPPFKRDTGYGTRHKRHGDGGVFFAVLDESTASLDVTSEVEVYAQCKARGMGFLSVAHRPTVIKFHTKVLDFYLEGGQLKWKEIDGQLHASAMAAKIAASETYEESHELVTQPAPVRRFTSPEPRSGGFRLIGVSVLQCRRLHQRLVESFGPEAAHSMMERLACDRRLTVRDVVGDYDTERRPAPATKSNPPPATSHLVLITRELRRR